MSDGAAGRLLGSVLDLYRDLHAHPELPGREVRTAERFAQALADRAIPVTSGIGGTGVVGAVLNGPGPAILLRAELDALPVAERTGLSYASTHPGVMHACGHDAHLAALAGVADLLAAERDAWSGTVLVLAQPAEEELTGARAVLADGLFERFGRPDVVVAQHLAPLPAGVVAHPAPGTAITLAGAMAQVVVRGGGGHAALPGVSHNPLTSVGRLLAGIAELASRLPPATVVTCGSVHGGEAANVVPERAELNLSLRAPDVRGVRSLLTDVHHLIGATIQAPLTAEVIVTEPVAEVRPTTDVQHRARSAHRERFGTQRVWDGYRSTAVDDVSALGESGVPVVYWMTGCIGAEAWKRARGTAHERVAAIPANHSPAFAPDPGPTLTTAVLALHAATIGLLNA